MRKAANNKVNIPLDLIPPVLSAGKVSALQIFVAAKFFSSGYLRGADQLNEFCLFAGFSRRTVLFYLRQLHANGWVGFDAATNCWYFRSWSWFRSKGLISRNLAVCTALPDLQHFQAFLAAALVSDRIRRQQIYNRSQEAGFLPSKAPSPKRLSPAISIRGIASQGVPSGLGAAPGRTALPYFGLSVSAMAEMFHLSHTRTSELKAEAVAAGYLKTRKQYSLIQPLSARSPNIRSLHLRAFPEKKNVRVITRRSRSGSSFLLVEQLHDEIFPALSLVRTPYAKRLRRAFLLSLSPVGFKKTD